MGKGAQRRAHHRAAIAIEWWARFALPTLRHRIWSPRPVVEQTRDLVLVARIHQRRPLRPASLHRKPAAGVKRASRRRIDRAWHVAVDQWHELFGKRIGDRYRGEQRLRVGMARICKQLVL